MASESELGLMERDCFGFVMQDGAGGSGWLSRGGDDVVVRLRRFARLGI
jgi:hypothetical protein